MVRIFVKCVRNLGVRSWIGNVQCGELFRHDTESLLLHSALHLITAGHPLDHLVDVCTFLDKFFVLRLNYILNLSLQVLFCLVFGLSKVSTLKVLGGVLFLLERILLGFVRVRAELDVILLSVLALRIGCEWSTFLQPRFVIWVANPDKLWLFIFRTHDFLLFGQLFLYLRLSVLWLPHLLFKFAGVFSFYISLFRCLLRVGASTLGVYAVLWLSFAFAAAVFSLSLLFV